MIFEKIDNFTAALTKRRVPKNVPNRLSMDFLPIDEYKIWSTFTEHYPHAFGWYTSFEDCFEDFLFHEST